MRDRYDVVIVGGGVMGSSTARALARRGLSVVLLERWHVGHTRGSSHGRSRIFRFSYPDARYVAMAQESLELWRALEVEAGVPIVVTTGGLDGGKRLDEHVSALRDCGAEFELMGAPEVERRWPFVRLPAGQEVLYQPDAGIALADRAWGAFADSARRNGAEVVEGARVLAIESAGDGVEVTVTRDRRAGKGAEGRMTGRAEKGAEGRVTGRAGKGAEPTVSGRAETRTIRADVAVVTAGSWTRSLLEPTGIDLATKPTRETVAFFEFVEPGPAFIEGAPEVRSVPTFVDWGEPSVYALPSPGQGIKVGEHIAGPVVDPDTHGAPSEESIERLARWISERYPGAAARPHHAETCLYTVTPDEHFVLERHGPIVVGSPCSGHGFKFAPLIGERLATLATGT